jgi:hypothetical protein
MPGMPMMMTMAVPMLILTPMVMIMIMWAHCAA